MIEYNARSIGKGDSTYSSKTGSWSSRSRYLRTLKPFCKEYRAAAEILNKLLNSMSVIEQQIESDIEHHFKPSSKHANEVQVTIAELFFRQFDFLMEDIKHAKKNLNKLPVLM